MNKDNARDYLPLVQALAEGKTIQVKIHDLQGNFLCWEDEDNLNFKVPPYHYRIKPEPKKDWARLALLKDDKEYFSGRADKDMGSSEDEIIKGLEDLYCAHFVRWLTDRIEYTLPEGDAQLAELEGKQ